MITHTTGAEETMPLNKQKLTILSITIIMNIKMEENPSHIKSS